MQTLGHSRATRTIPYLLPGVRDILFLSIVIAVLLLGQRMLNMDGDLPRHLETGKIIFTTHSIPRTEPFVFPYKEQAYVSHEWLSDLVLYLIYKTTGLAGIVVLSAILLGTAFARIYSYVSRKYNLYIPALILVAWGAAITSLNWVTRPHLISMLFLAIWLIRVDRLASGEKLSLITFPILMALWSNFHGEFIAGILVLLAYTVGFSIDQAINKEAIPERIVKKLWLVLFICLAATLLNPYGIRPWATIINFMNNPYLMSRMAEARPPDIGETHFLVLFLFLGISIILLTLKRRRMPASQGFLLAGFSAMCLMAARNVHLYGIIGPFVLSGSVDWYGDIRFFQKVEEIIGKTSNTLRGILWPTVSVLVALGVVLWGPLHKEYKFNPTFFPVDTVAWLNENPQTGNLFNDINWGGYIALQTWPKYPVFIDSMADINGQITRKYETVIMMGDGWEDVLDDYHIEWMIVPVNSMIVQNLRASQQWEVVYEDPLAAILVYQK